MEGNLIDSCIRKWPAKVITKHIDLSLHRDTLSILHIFFLSLINTWVFHGQENMFWCFFWRWPLASPMAFPLAWRYQALPCAVSQVWQMLAEVQDIVLIRQSLLKNMVWGFVIIALQLLFIFFLFSRTLQLFCVTQNCEKQDGDHKRVSVIYTEA